MKKIWIIAALCLLALTAVACTTGGTDDTGSADTTAEAVTDGVTEAETETDTAAETVTEIADTETDTTADTEGDTEPEETTEAETAPPRYDYMSADVGADVTLSADQYKSMQLTLPASLRVTDEDVAAYIEYIRFQYRTVDGDGASVTDQPLRMGDDAYIYYKGIVDGEVVSNASNWDDAGPRQLGLGSGAFVPGFEESLVGVIPANATRENPVEVRVTFPEDYSSELAGKDAVFYVAVMYSVQYTLPTYNRDFVENTLMYEGEKEFYAGDKAFLAEFEGYVRSYLEGQMQEDIDYAKIDALWNYLTEVATCVNHPQMEIDYYYNAYLDEIEYYYDYYKSYGGTAFTDAYPDLDAFARYYVGVAEGEDWKAELRAVSTDMVEKDMIGHAIGEWEGMEIITDEEYAAELSYWYDYYSGYMTKEEIETHMGKDTLRETAFAEKMQSWLLSRATFTFEETV